MSSYKEGGWDDKYIISKANGHPIDSEAQYFVLRYDKDPHAVVAMDAYANSVERDNPLLAADIRARLRGVW